MSGWSNHGPSGTGKSTTQRTLILVPSTGAVKGGFCIRPDGGPGGELLISNPAGKGICVLGTETSAGMRLSPSVFDIALTRRLAQEPRVSPVSVRQHALEVASEGFAGRKIQNLARATASSQESIAVGIKQWLQMRVPLQHCSPLVLTELADIYAMTGTTHGDSPVARQIALLTRTVTALNALAEKYPHEPFYVTSAALVQNVAAVCSGLFAASLRLVAAPEGLLAAMTSRSFAPSLLMTHLMGWSRYCLLLDELIATGRPGWLQEEIAALTRLLLHAAPVEFASVNMKERALKWTPGRSGTTDTDDTPISVQRQTELNEQRLYREIRLIAPRNAL